MRRVAFRIKTELPISVVQVLGAEWKGGPLVQIEESLIRPSVEDLILNSCWIKPFVQQFRDRVPSGFFIADCFLMLDKIWLGRLLLPLQEGESKFTLAASEAKKVKTLIGALRTLRRSSHLVVVLKGVVFV